MDDITKDKILKMEPGPELNTLINERIFKFITYPKNRFIAEIDGDECEYAEIPHYSTDTKAAWEIVEKLKRTDIDGFGDFRLYWGNYGEDTTPKGPCGSRCYPLSMVWLAAFEGIKNCIGATWETAPEAICKAALLATLEKDAPHG